jgi:hypothetical protein
MTESATVKTTPVWTSIGSLLVGCLKHGARLGGGCTIALEESVIQLVVDCRHVRTVNGAESRVAIWQSQAVCGIANP